jgi:transglutaminase-like putative cysteine protease
VYHPVVRRAAISTPVDEVLETRMGVCQDFAHLMIACLRSLALPPRYVSGYLRSGEHSVGAEASHAWCSMFCPGFGWLDFDPTNDVMPQANHVTIAVGRDYSDVTPVKGVAIGGGDQILNVAVEVVPAR